jgi:hypothetical protein
MGTMKIDLTIEVDTDSILRAASVVMREAPTEDVIGHRVREALKALIKSGMPHVVSVRDFNYKDC